MNVRHQQQSLTFFLSFNQFNDVYLCTEINAHFLKTSASKGTPS